MATLVNARPVAQIPTGVSNIIIYDSGNIFPDLYRRPINNNIVHAFGIPSSRYFYQSRQNTPVPYLATAESFTPSDQPQRDIEAWRTTIPGPRIYILDNVDTIDPEVDLVNITQGYKVNVPASQLFSWITEMTQTLTEMGSYQIERDQRFAINSGIEQIAQSMANIPFNPAANYIEASRLATIPNVEYIRLYLTERGIVTIRAEDIINLSVADIFFYLTRFFGPPEEGDFESKSLERVYTRLAQNDYTRRLAQMIPANLKVYNLLTKEFNQYFEYINRNGLTNEAYNALGSTHPERFMNSFFEYLGLLRTGNNLPVLTLLTIRQLRARTIESVTSFLRQYPDRKIISLVGNQINSATLRRDFLAQAADALLRSRTFLLSPVEADLCQNKISIEEEEFSKYNRAFIGRGNLAENLTCYDIDEIFMTFENNKTTDGFYVFKDSNNYQNEFRVQDLRDMRSAVATGRAGVSLNQAEYQRVLREFDKYIDLAEVQTNSDYRQIRILRNWTNENPANTDLMRNVWLSYFRMGMYMRQWAGPGHPYPVLATQTGRERSYGSQEEIVIAENVSRENYTFREVMSALPQNIQDVIWSLQVVNRENGQIANKGRTIRYRYNDVTVGGEETGFCIRMASSPWAFSGAYYLKQIINENIPGFDLGVNIALIQ